MVVPFSSFLEVDAGAAVGLAISIIPEEERKPENFYVGMVAGSQAFNADWWFVKLEDGEYFSFDLDTGTFVPGLQPSYQGPIFDTIEPLHIWSLPELPSGEFTLMFGIDGNADGVVNESSLIGTGFTYYFP